MSTTLYLRFPKSLRPDEEVEVSSEKKVTIGRTDKSDVALSQYYDKYTNLVSRKHCEISWQDGQFVIVDLESKNGTWVNRARLRRGGSKTLRDGDVIKIANHANLFAEVEIKRVIKPEDTDPIDTDAIYTEPILRDLLQELQQDRDVMLLGLAGVGKTTLLRKLIAPSDTPDMFNEFWPDHISFLPCYVNGLAIRDTTLEGFFRELIATTKPAFGKWPDEIRRCDQLLASGGCSIRDISSAMKTTIQTVHRQRHKGVLFLLDHFDDYYPKLPWELFSVLKELKTIEPRVMYVIAMRNEFDTTNQYIDQFLRLIDPPNYYWLPEMSEYELENVASRHERRSDQKIRISIELGGGQPRLTELVASCLQKMPHVPSDRSALIQQLLAHKIVNNHCREIWNSLSTEEKKGLWSVVSGNPTMSYPIQFQLTQNRRLLIGETEKLRIKNPLLEAYVRSRGTGLQEKMAAAQLQATAVSAKKPSVITASGEEIKVHGKAIPLKHLSKLQHKLLVYMYEKADKLCTHDDIWLEVWGYDSDDPPSTESIANMIRNLRNRLDKISDGAGKRYIETVFGRGYMYVS